VTLRIGIGLFTGQVPVGSDRTFAHEYRDTLELVRLAEALGFDSAWVSEHHGASDGYLPSLLTMLAGFAAATDRIRLGTGVVLTPLHDPLRLAEDAAVVDQLSGGRLTLGLGIAWRPEEFRMFGVPFSERLARTVDTVEILRRAWTGERFSFEGEVFHYDRVRVTPPPAQVGGPPILLGGYVDAAMRRAGRIGDGHITDAEDVEAVRHAAALMEEGAREAGRDPSRLTIAIMQNAFRRRRRCLVARARRRVPPDRRLHGVGRGRPTHPTTTPWNPRRHDESCEPRRRPEHPMSSSPPCGRRWRASPRAARSTSSSACTTPA
jgi:probable F420-dependent oxidoreductase